MSFALGNAHTRHDNTTRIRTPAFPTGPASYRFLQAAITSNRPLVAVVGGLGFEDSHIVFALLRAGYFVRAIVPEGADTTFLTRFPSASTRLQLIPVRDLAAEDARLKLLLAFRGVSTVIHAPTFSFKSSSTATRASAGRRIVQALKLSLDAACAPDSLITNFIYLSSELTVYDPTIHHPSSPHWFRSSRRHGKPVIPILTENNWFDVSRRSCAHTYPIAHALTVAELRLWARAAKNPMPFNLISLIPSFTIGPIFAERHVHSSPGIALLASTAHGIKPPPDFPANPVDVRDVARAIILLLDNKALVGGRILLSAQTMTSTELVARARKFFPSQAPQPRDSRMRLSRTYCRPAPMLKLPDATQMLKNGDIAVKGRIGRQYAFSQVRATQHIALRFNPVDNTLRDTIRSLQRFNITPKPNAARYSAP